MKKILTSLIAILLIAVSHLKAEERVLVVKPMAATTANTTTNWGGSDAVNEEKYIMQKVEGEDNLYMCSITLNQYFKTNKWATKWGEEYDPENPNEGWSDEYQYHVVYQDSYTLTDNGAVTGNSNPKPFKVDADGTTVTFYARLVQVGDYTTDAHKYVGKIRSFCDAQAPIIKIWNDADSVMPAGIGKKSAGKEIYVNNNGKKEITLYSGKEWMDFISDQHLPKHVVSGRGRHIVNLDYERIFFSVYKVLDETDYPKLKIGNGEYQDAENFVGNIGIFSERNPLLLSASIDGKTVEEGSSEINTEMVSAYLYYEISSENQIGGIVDRILLTTEAGETNHATWTSDAINVVEDLSEGEYTIKVWYEMSVGIDTLRNDNNGNGYIATFSISDESSSVSAKLEMYTDGGFETICLPFSVMEIIDNEGSPVSSVRLLEYSNNIEETVYFSEATGIQANIPYLIALPEEEGEKKEITFIGTTVETADPVVTRGSYNFIGTYDIYRETEDPNYYVMNITGDSFVKAVTNTYVPANRAYFKAINSASHSTLKVDIDGTTGGNLIEEHQHGIVIYSMENGVRVFADEVTQLDIYSIEGRLVRKAQIVKGENMIKGLMKGIYIINNQKVAVK